MFLGTEGIIAAGKSEFAKRLARLMGFEYFGEPFANNPILPWFYKDIRRWGFTAQIGFLHRRFKQHQVAVFGITDENTDCQYGDQWPGVVQDRTIYADSIFVRMLVKQGMMTQEEAKEYFSLFALMRHFLDVPDGIVYLDVEPDVAYERIQRRGREMEKAITLEYLIDLGDEYESFLEDIVDLGIPVHRVDWNIDRPEEEWLGAIEQEIPVIRQLRKGCKNRFRRSIRQL